ncbi:unnamed protein product [Adineta steineri]|uniref:G-protein coupled receptors family 1 profile domain-containing protein n=1 Tax=Adineta steineri TaxID=433720 RepID=A0A815URL0_9BILA|nr:unnamed protein product [Adineta steineri]CAF1519783.1 unnamed protein product [Adineta steineri]
MTDSLIQLAIQMTRAIVPIIILVGIIGNSLNIAVLSRPSLYNHACSRYFLALACNNLFYTSTMMIYRLLADGYQLDITKVSPISCKLIVYTFQTCGILSQYFVILASIDRYCASSSNVYLRKFSNVKVTRWAVLFVMMIIMLFYINTAVLIDLRTTDSYGCRVRGDTIYKQAYSIIQVILYAIIAPILMAIFGMMTIYNTKKVRVAPIIVSRHRRTENQLAFMLMIQVIVNIILTMPTCVTYLMLIMSLSIQTTSTFYFVRTISQLLLYFSFTTPFMLYVVSARVYRKELIQFMCRLLRLRNSNLIHLSTSTITNHVVPFNITIHKTTIL